MSSAKTGSWKQNGGDILHSRVCFKPRSFKVEFRIYNLKLDCTRNSKRPARTLISSFLNQKIEYIVHYTVHYIHSIILCTVYTSLYCTLYTLHYTVHCIHYLYCSLADFCEKKDQLRKPWSDKGLKGTLLVGNVTYVMEGNNKLPLQSF